MSRDGYLPDNVSEADFDRAFPPNYCPVECPNGEDWEPKLCSDCEEKIAECVCWLYDVLPYRLANLFRRFSWTRGLFGDSTAPEEPGECTCPSAAEIDAERAECWAESREDR